MPFTTLGLRPELLSAITARGYEKATPIQSKSIPKILEGRDVLAGAQTGTGKTAAFALPILQLLSDRPRKGHRPRALILTPTRELAAQIVEFIQQYGKSLTLYSAAVFGGVHIRPQITKLRKGVDILVATPGRLLDHAEQKTVDLSLIEILVLDEADRMLDMGFIRDIRRIMKLLPRKRQNLLFSATYSDEIKRLSSDILHNPALIEVASRNTTADTVDQVVHPVSRSRKHALLSQLINEGNWSQVLVFTRTKHAANKLAKLLNAGNISAVPIHGNKSQGARTRALADFKRGSVRVLVATDIAARGLDINLLPHVVNYELSDTAENYVHRIGRTGRAGAEGKAISLVSPEEQKGLQEIHRLLGRTLPVETIEGFEAKPEPRNNSRGQQRRPHPRARTANKKRPSGNSKSYTANDGRAQSPRKKSAANKRNTDPRQETRPTGNAYAGKKPQKRSMTDLSRQRKTRTPK